MPIVAYLTVHPETKALEVYQEGTPMPNDRRWEAVKFEIDKPEDGGEPLVYYVARTRAMADRIAPGRAVFIEAELRANEPYLRSVPTAEKHAWVRWACMAKTLFGAGTFVESTTPSRARPFDPAGPLVRAAFIGRDGQEIDLETLEPVRREPDTTTAPTAPAPLPEGLL